MTITGTPSECAARIEEYQGLADEVVAIRIASGSARVRSGEITTRSSPLHSDFITRFAAAYTTSGSCGDRKNGVFQL